MESVARVGEEQASARTISNGLSPLPEDLVGDEESRDKNRTSGGLFFDVTELITEIVDSVLDLPSVEAGQLEEIQTKFDLWADGVEVTSGRLDNLIGSSRELKESLSLIYFSFLSSLTDNIISPYFDQILAFVEKLVYSNQSAPEISPKELDEKVLIIENDFASRIQDGTDQFIVAFDTFQRQLSRTAPFIIDFLRDCEQKDTFTFLDDDQLEQNEGTENDADVAVSRIIARELWELYRNVKATLYQEVNHTVNEEPIETEKVVTIIEHDSTYESMQKSLAASLIKPPIQRVRIALSDIATELTSSSCKLTDRPLVSAPPEGVELGPGISFTCQFCLEKVTDIDNLKKWRMHILSDIRPYFCTFPDCQNNTLRYKSKTEWMAHEVEFHRLKTSWRCNLKSCGEKFTSQLALQSHLIAERNISPLWDNLSLGLPNQASKIASHIGRHLEDFALPITSQLDDGDEDVDELLSDSSDGLKGAEKPAPSSPTPDPEDDIESPMDETHTSNATDATVNYPFTFGSLVKKLKIMIFNYISKETYSWEEEHSHSDFDFSRFYLVGVINEQGISYNRLSSTDSLQFHYHLQRQAASNGHDAIWLTKVPNSIPWSEVDFSEIWAGLGNKTLPYKGTLQKHTSFIWFRPPTITGIARYVWD
ncbi:hypothetical protein H072_6045 [Dactylellina haptotyla CBS 200.50]|uniref:C2H2-type domain-containing protein n=1 Tax=Dactylellina haptotyla (strain CBS 200.50) TaxID=1284197 RepID=S8AG72_DACHA|nr:hypothetical protein H072_6045 [Dactylellina haptotyla CBS 200.50]